MNPKKFILTIVALGVLIGAYMAWDYYQRIFAPNVSLENSSVEFYINSDSDYQKVLSDLTEKGIISSSTS